jgi:hypothetical protein
MQALADNPEDPVVNCFEANTSRTEPVATKTCGFAELRCCRQSVRLLEIRDVSLCREKCDMVRAIVTGATRDRAPLAKAGAKKQCGRRDPPYCVINSA